MGITLKMSLCLAVSTLFGWINLAHAALLPGGDFESPHFPTNVPSQTFTGQGTWGYSVQNQPAYQNPIISVTTETGGNRYALIDSSNTWWNWGRVFYTADQFTPADTSWTFSTDVKASKPFGDYDPYSIRLQSGDSTSAAVIGFSFNQTTKSITWQAGSQSGTVVALNDIDGTWRSISFEYDPNTGHAVGTFAGETIFDVVTQQNLQIKTITFEAGWGNNTYGRLWIDNVSMTVLPEPATVSLLLSGVLLMAAPRRSD